VPDSSSEASPELPQVGRVFLVVDDDPMVRRIVTRGLESLEPAEVLEREDGLAAQAVLRERHVDLVITDVVMPNMDGLALMKWAQEECPGPLWIVLSGVETFDTAVEALQLGAFDYLAKPPELPRVRVAVRNALDQIELVQERQRLYAKIEDSNRQLAEKVAQLQTVCRVLEDQAATIQADLDRAEVIQRALLPQKPPPTPGWCMETLYRPGSSVGGDFYDAVCLEEDHLGIVIADAAGHGVAAAMLSVLFKLRFQQISQPGTVLAPAEVLRRLNDGLYDMLSTPGAFVTATYALIDLRSGRVRIASAGHPPCVVTRAGGDFSLIARTGPALGLVKDPEYTEHDFLLGSRDRLLLYTDGVVEGGPHSPREEDIAKAMQNIDDRHQCLEQLFNDAARELEVDRDDVTMLLLQRAEGTSHFDDADSAIPAEDEATAPKKRSAAPEHPQLSRGEREGRGFIAVSGAVTWLCGPALFEAARSLLERNAALTIDLSRCEHMDSTCLGTLYEIVVSNPGAVELQGVSSGVRGLFDELSMTAVLDVIGAGERPLPDTMTEMQASPLTPQQQGARILSAHETLLHLSEENEEQFRAVVDSLRADLS
jgi:serine phosphatase RsbU (regulator of sigma subunit)/ABC-type transporter Mla MlaB component